VIGGLLIVVLLALCDFFKSPYGVRVVYSNPFLRQAQDKLAQGDKQYLKFKSRHTSRYLPEVLKKFEVAVELVKMHFLPGCLSP
jgi:hypothetical protein